MSVVLIFIFVIILTYIYIFNQNNLILTNYNIILINHHKFQIIIIKNMNKIENKIYKIYKD